MGCDCKVYLPDNVRIGDVSKVMTILSCEKGYAEFVPFSGSTSGSVRVEGIEFQNTHTPEYFIIRFPVNSESSKSFRNKDSEGSALCHYFFETESSGRLVTMRSTPFWCAIAKNLVDFFGGKVDYNDCDKTDVDYEVKAKSNDENCPTDGKEWDDFQKRILAVESLTEDDVKKFVNISAY